MKRRICIGGIVLVALVATAAMGQAPATEPAVSRDQLEGIVRPRLFAALNARREAILKSEALAGMSKAVREAESALAAKMAAQGAIGEARKLADETDRKLAATISQRVNADPEAVAAREAAKAIDGQLAEVASQYRQAEFQMAEVKRKLIDDPELKKLQEASVRAHEQARDGQAEAADARKAVDAARSALDAKTRTLPEYAALREAEAMLAAALKAPKLVELAKVADDAQHAWDAELARRLAASPDGAAQIARTKELTARTKELAEKRNAAVGKIRPVRERVEKSDEAIAQARKAHDAAVVAYRATVVEETKAEQSALDSARKAMQTKLAEALEADAEAKALRGQLDAVTRQIKETPATKPAQ